MHQEVQTIFFRKKQDFPLPPELPAHSSPSRNKQTKMLLEAERRWLERATVSVSQGKDQGLRKPLGFSLGSSAWREMESRCLHHAQIQKGKAVLTGHYVSGGKGDGLVNTPCSQAMAVLPVKLSEPSSQRHVTGKKPQGLGQRRRLSTHTGKMPCLKGKTWTSLSQEVLNTCLGGRSEFQSWAVAHGEVMQVREKSCRGPPDRLSTLPSVLPSLQRPIAHMGSFALQQGPTH